MSDQALDTSGQEATIFARYLIGSVTDQQSIDLYRSATHDSKLDVGDAKLLRFMLAHPHSIGFIDAGLVFIKPESQARRRLYVMFAILEASPEYCDFFLAKRRSPLYPVMIVLIGIRAVLKIVLGIPLVRLVS